MKLWHGWVTLAIVLAASLPACGAFLGDLDQLKVTEAEAGTLPEDDSDATAAEPESEAGTGVTGCASPRKVCAGECIDVGEDPENCGSCGKRCKAGELCAKGACVTSCPSGLEACGASCVDTQESVDHCGKCNTPCPAAPGNATRTCKGGECGTECVSPAKLCGGACKTKADLCGAKVCGSDGCGGTCGSCPSTKVCSTSGACVCKPIGTTCGGAAECCTGVCTSNACACVPFGDQCTKTSDCCDGWTCKPSPNGPAYCFP